VAKYFAGREVIIVPDLDEAGAYKAWECADALHGVAAPIRTVKLPGLTGRPDDKDFSDWLDAVPARADTFVEICLSAEYWTPCPAPPKPATNKRRKHDVAKASTTVGQEASENEFTRSRATTPFIRCGIILTASHGTAPSGWANGCTRISAQKATSTPQASAPCF
jgi:hypothetical protein